MEMEYKDPSKRGRWIVLAGVVLAVVAGGAAFFLINNAQQQAGQSGLKTTTGWSPCRPIPARKPIEAEDLAVRSDIPLDGTNAEGDRDRPRPARGSRPGGRRQGRASSSRRTCSPPRRPARSSRSSSRTRPSRPTPRHGGPSR